MAYVSTELKEKVQKELERLLDKRAFSLSVRNHSTLVVKFKKLPVREGIAVSWAKTNEGIYIKPIGPERTPYSLSFDEIYKEVNKESYLEKIESDEVELSILQESRGYRNVVNFDILTIAEANFLRALTDAINIENYDESERQIDYINVGYYTQEILLKNIICGDIGCAKDRGLVFFEKQILEKSVKSVEKKLTTVFRKSI